MSQELMELARRVFDNWKLGEIDEMEIRSIFHPDVEFLPLRAATEGTYRGIAGLEKFAGGHRGGLREVRQARVNSSGDHTAGRKPAASNSHSVLASTLSVLTLDSAIAESLRVLAITTRATWPSRIRAIASAPPVASSATSSSGARLCANSSSSETELLTRPASRSPDSSLIATSQKSRCTSSAIDRM